jgi:hypothetical protein
MTLHETAKSPIARRERRKDRRSDRGCDPDAGGCQIATVPLPAPIQSLEGDATEIGVSNDNHDAIIRPLFDV